MDAPRNLPAHSDESSLGIIRFDAIHEPQAPVPPQAPGAATSPSERTLNLDPPAGQKLSPGGSAVLGTRAPGPIEHEALHRSNALMALDALAGWGQAVSVIEVLQTAPDLSTYLLQRWECAPVGNESDPAYCKRSIREGETFILGYGDPGDGSITYRVLPFDSEPLRRAA